MAPAKRYRYSVYSVYSSEPRKKFYFVKWYKSKNDPSIKEKPLIILIKNRYIAESYKNHFEVLWGIAYK